MDESSHTATIALGGFSRDFFSYHAQPDRFMGCPEPTLLQINMRRLNQIPPPLLTLTELYRTLSGELLATARAFYREIQTLVETGASR